MPVKLTKDQESKLNCICGLCNHDAWTTTCVYNKILAAKEPALEEKHQIMMFVEQVVRTSNGKTMTKKTPVKKTQKTTRAKIAPKKGKR